VAEPRRLGSLTATAGANGSRIYGGSGTLAASLELVSIVFADVESRWRFAPGVERIMKRILVVPVALAMIVGACGQSAPATDSRKIEIEMRDFTFFPDSLTLRAGEKVTLSFKNTGKVEHEFMAGNEPTERKGYLKDWFADSHIEASGGEHGMAGHEGTGVRVAPNKSETLTFVVPRQGGLFEFGCFVSGHYEFGMRGRLVVDVEVAPNAAPSGRGAERGPGSSAAPTHAPLGDDDGEGH
jgi:uncharacterized cupredoxin-like copper-binding protein